MPASRTFGDGWTKDSHPYPHLSHLKQTFKKIERNLRQTLTAKYKESEPVALKLSNNSVRNNKSTGRYHGPFYMYIRHVGHCEATIAEISQVKHEKDTRQPSGTLDQGQEFTIPGRSRPGCKNSSREPGGGGAGFSLFNWGRS